MTLEQIIKAVEICKQGDTCKGCPYRLLDTAECIRDLMKDVFDLISRRKAEIEKLKAKLKQKNPYEEYGNCVAIGDSLVFTHTLNDYDKLIKEIGTDAIWEFAERLKNKIWYHPACNRERLITPDYIYDLAREMTEEK